MQDFSALKQEEERILDAEIQERDDALHHVEAFSAKREGLLSEITSITSQTGARSADRLQIEANELDTQIQELENRLFEMKARHRHLLDEAQQLENSVQSMLSSYNASLELLDKDIRRFLTRPPIVQPSSGAVRQPVSASVGADESFYGLNPKRRTLEMASEHWREERESLERRKEAIRRERTALEDGGRVWRQAVAEIGTLEQNLRGQMQKLLMGSMLQQERDEGMAAVLGSMEKTMEVLERRLQEAEEKDWRLLICCIGAELEGLREGREILLEASSGLREDPHTQNKNGLPEGREDPSDLALTPPSEDFLRQPTVSAEEDATLDHGTERPIVSSEPVGDGQERNNKLPPSRARTGSDSRSESEDDDPGPDFLISHT
jgi:chromosome segregation ATPase